MTRLVFEGYWRFLEFPEPTAKETGLIRLFVGRRNRSPRPCAAARRCAPGAARLVGATGWGNTAPAAPLSVTWIPVPARVDSCTA